MTERRASTSNPKSRSGSESLSLAVASLEYEATRVTLIDTPGYADFSAEVVEGFAAADAALFVMDASAAWNRAWRSPSALVGPPGRAACFFINKSDRENADPTAALDTLRAAFGNKIAPLHLAIGKGESLQRLRGPRPSQGVAVGRQPGSRDPDPGGTGGRGRHRRDQLSRPPPRPTTMC